MGSPYSFIQRGNLFVIPIGPSIAEVPYPTYSITKPKDYSLWVRGVIEEPDSQLDRARMPPSLYQDVRDDLVKFSPVPVSRSAFRRSQHAYVGVIDSNGTPYHFALDSNGISVREVPTNDDSVWKTFDRLADEERSMALQQRRTAATAEMVDVERELSEPMLVIKTNDEAIARRYAISMALSAREIARQIGDDEAEADEDEELEYLGYNDSGVEKSGGFLWHIITHRGAKHKVGRAARDPKSPSASHVAREKAPNKEKKPHELKFRTSESGKQHRATAPHGKYKISTNTGYRHELHYQRHLHEKTSLGTFKTAQEAAAHAHAHHAKAHHNHTPAPAASHKPESTPTPNHAPAPATHKPAASASHAPLPRRALHERLATPSYLPGVHATTHPTRKQPRSTMKSFEVEQPLLVIKALPKKPKEDTVKKKPTSGAAKKQTGAGGKTRYTYPNEKGGGAGGKKGPQQQPIVIEHDDSKNADPTELANQLGVSIRTLQRTALRLGRDGFSKFMRAHLKRFSAKHNIDPDYWGTMYERLRTQPSLEADSYGD